MYGLPPIYCRVHACSGFKFQMKWKLLFGELWRANAWTSKRKGNDYNHVLFNIHETIHDFEIYKYLHFQPPANIIHHICQCVEHGNSRLNFRWMLVAAPSTCNNLFLFSLLLLLMLSLFRDRKEAHNKISYYFAIFFYRQTQWLSDHGQVASTLFRVILFIWHVFRVPFDDKHTANRLHQEHFGKCLHIPFTIHFRSTTAQTTQTQNVRELYLHCNTCCVCLFVQCLIPSD